MSTFLNVETQFSLLLLCAIILVGIVVTGEVLMPKGMEGFTNPTATYWSSFVGPRGDIGPSKEDSAYIRDPRYFNDYANVSRIGVPYDFCRVVASVKTPDKPFFACALAGTDNLESTSFRTDSIRLSRDDYMRDINGDGRDDYCRILVTQNGSYQAICAKSGDSGFDSTEVVDPSPPDNISTLLTFYNGCVIWFRFIDDMLDTVNAVTIHTSGKIAIDEKPSPTTQGLSFDGTQFLRLSDSPSMNLQFVPLRSIRAWMVWVKFDEFTNNAKIFDFGNGKESNVFLGILGKGDSGVQDCVIRENTSDISIEEVTPQELMTNSPANVNEYECTGFEIYPRKLKHPFPQTQVKTKQGSASLLYEVWDKQSRKMRILLNNSIPLKKWTHIAITATNEDAFRPNLSVYINGEKRFTKEGGFLPSTGKMSDCYIGKSNWADSTSQYENRDELFKGSLFDFRAYKTIVSAKLINDSIIWGKEKLAIK